MIKLSLYHVATHRDARASQIQAVADVSVVRISILTGVYHARSGCKYIYTEIVSKMVSVHPLKGLGNLRPVGAHPRRYLDGVSSGHAEPHVMRGSRSKAAAAFSRSRPRPSKHPGGMVRGFARNHANSGERRDTVRREGISRSLKADAVQSCHGTHNLGVLNANSGRDAGTEVADQAPMPISYLAQRSRSDGTR